MSQFSAGGGQDQVIVRLTADNEQLKAKLADAESRLARFTDQADKPGGVRGLARAFGGLVDKINDASGSILGFLGKLGAVTAVATTFFRIGTAISEPIFNLFRSAEERAAAFGESMNVSVGPEVQANIDRYSEQIANLTVQIAQLKSTLQAFPLMPRGLVQAQIDEMERDLALAEKKRAGLLGSLTKQQKDAMAGGDAVARQRQAETLDKDIAIEGKRHAALMATTEQEAIQIELEARLIELAKARAEAERLIDHRVRAKAIELVNAQERTILAASAIAAVNAKNSILRTHQEMLNGIKDAQQRAFGIGTQVEGIGTGTAIQMFGLLMPTYIRNMGGR